MVQVSTEAGWLLSQLGNRYSESLVATAQSRGEGAATINRLQADLQNMRRIVSLVEQDHAIPDSDMGWLTRTLSHAFGEHHLLGTDTYTAQPLEEVLRCHGRDNLLNLMSRWDSLALHGSVHQTTEEMRRRLGGSHWSHTARNIVHDFVERMNTWEGVSQTALSIGTGIGAGVIVGTFLPAAGVVAFVGRSLMTSIVQTSLTNGVENCRRVLSDRELISQSEWVQGFKTNVWENLLGDLAGARVAHEILEELVNMAVSTAGADVAHGLGILEEEYQNVGSYWERLGENGLNTLMMKGMRRVSEGGVRLARFVGEVNPVNVAMGVGVGVTVGGVAAVTSGAMSALLTKVGGMVVMRGGVNNPDEVRSVYPTNLDDPAEASRMIEIRCDQMAIDLSCGRYGTHVALQPDRYGLKGGRIVFEHLESSGWRLLTPLQQDHPFQLPLFRALERLTDCSEPPRFEDFGVESFHNALVSLESVSRRIESAINYGSEVVAVTEWNGHFRYLQDHLWQHLQNDELTPENCEYLYAVINRFARIPAYRRVAMRLMVTTVMAMPENDQNREFALNLARASCVRDPLVWVDSFMRLARLFQTPGRTISIQEYAFLLELGCPAARDYIQNGIDVSQQGDLFHRFDRRISWVNAYFSRYFESRGEAGGRFFDDSLLSHMDLVGVSSPGARPFFEELISSLDRFPSGDFRASLALSALESGYFDDRVESVITQLIPRPYYEWTRGDSLAYLGSSSTFGKALRKRAMDSNYFHLASLKELRRVRENLPQADQNEITAFYRRFILDQTEKASRGVLELRQTDVFLESLRGTVLSDEERGFCEALLKQDTDSIRVGRPRGLVGLLADDLNGGVWAAKERLHLDLLSTARALLNRRPDADDSRPRSSVTIPNHFREFNPPVPENLRAALNRGQVDGFTLQQVLDEW